MPFLLFIKLNEISENLFMFEPNKTKLEKSEFSLCHYYKSILISCETLDEKIPRIEVKSVYVLKD